MADIDTYCINCKFFVPATSDFPTDESLANKFGKCHCPNSTNDVDPITGIRTYSFASVSRKFQCGSDAKLFEPLTSIKYCRDCKFNKRTWMNKLFNEDGICKHSTSKTELIGQMLCLQARRSDDLWKCGSGGIHFEKRKKL